MFQSFFGSLVRSKYLSIFSLSFSVTLPDQHNSFTPGEFFQSASAGGLLQEFNLISKSVPGFYIYNLTIWSDLSRLHNSLCITLLT